jgi:hypothetical protein
MKCGIHPKRSLVGVVFTDGSRSWMKVVPGRRFVKVKAKAMLVSSVVGSRDLSGGSASKVGVASFEVDKVTSWCRLDKDPKNHFAWSATGGKEGSQA